MQKLSNLVLHDAQLIYRPNFEGRQEQYNRKGDRNFNVIIPEHMVEDLIEDGWNIKFSKPRDEEDIPVPYLKVAISFDPYPPMIFMVTKQKTMLDASTVALLDSSVILSSDLIINPSAYNVNGTSGIKAYLKKGYFIIEQDELDDKYASIPMSKMETLSPDDEVEF